MKAIVLKSGFNTAKGDLVRSILHPKPVDFLFNNDANKYVPALPFIAFLCMIVGIIIKIKLNNPITDIIQRSLDISKITVPPVLPAPLATSVLYAQKRLRAKHVYCISPRTINVCGAINTFEFGKTGTLTISGQCFGTSKAK